MCDVLDKAINQGREEGERSERQRSIRTMHIQGVGAEDIARFLQLDLAYVQEVLAQDA